jgi:hypothetical protein
MLIDVAISGGMWSLLYTATLLTWLSRRAQFGRCSSFGKRVWFTESRIILVISFFTCCFIYSFCSWYKEKVCCIQLNNKIIFY